MSDPDEIMEPSDPQARKRLRVVPTPWIGGVDVDKSATFRKGRAYRRLTPAERFALCYTENPETGCWDWIAARSHGYGRFTLPGRKSAQAHRYAYELLVGPIPTGMQLDHLCRNRACVNPAHLEPVTNRENTLRGTASLVNRERLTRDECAAGHPLAPDDPNVRITRSGKKQCRACGRERWRERNPSSKRRGVKREIASEVGPRTYLLTCGHIKRVHDFRPRSFAICADCDPGRRRLSDEERGAA